MANNKQVLLIGYGEMGHAFEHLLKPSCDIHIWQRSGDADRDKTTLEKTAVNSDVIFYCVPAAAIEHLAWIVSGAINQHPISVSFSKGLDKQGRTVSQIFQSTLQAEQKVALFFGPMISEEIRAGKASFAQVGTSHDGVFPTLDKLFEKTSLRLESSDDMIAINWAAVLKNVYAILFGLSDGLDMGDNVRGYLASACTREIGRIIADLNGNPDVVNGLSGIGDLITTATSKDSHHHALGVNLAAGKTDGITGEGPTTIAMIEENNVLAIETYPILNLVSGILSRPEEAEKQVRDYFGA